MRPGTRPLQKQKAVGDPDVGDVVRWAESTEAPHISDCVSFLGPKVRGLLRLVDA